MQIPVLVFYRDRFSVSFGGISTVGSILRELVGMP